MKDAKFIELLNLYVDHEITAADAALLETEIQQDPKRRQVYRQYCQMQKACVLMADRFRTEAPAEAQVIEFAPMRSRFKPLVYAAGVMAAAACVALVFVSRNRLDQQVPPVKSDVAVVVPQSVRPVAASVMPAPRMNRIVLQPAFNGLVRDGAADTAFTSVERAPLDWMTRVQFDRVPAEALRFETAQSMPTDDLLFRSRRTVPALAEGAAFRFQK